jgi:hypothetical protein
LHLESENRGSHTVKQQFVHGKWHITKIYVHGRLSEIIVERRDDSQG